MKKLILTVAICLSVFTFLSTSTYAQSLSQDSIKAQLVKEWERAKIYTVAYLNKMPADKYSFKAVDSIRSFAQQMIHLSQGNFGLMAKGTGKMPPAYAQADLEHSPGAQTKDSVMYYVTTSYDFCIDAVKTTDVNTWGEKIDFFGMHPTRFALIIKTFEHQTHHRGQTTIYIRLLGIKPPEEQLF